jgi:hypothetical protein
MFVLLVVSPMYVWQCSYNSSSLEQAKDAVGGGSGGLPNPFEAVKNAVSGSPDLPDPRTAASKVTGSVRP